jgi:hypothetical protein
MEVKNGGPKPSLPYGSACPDYHNYMLKELPKRMVKNIEELPPRIG